MKSIVLFWPSYILLLTVSLNVESKNEAPESFLPLEIKNCFEIIAKCDDSKNITDAKIDRLCSSLADKNGNGYIVTQEDVKYFLDLLGEMIEDEQRYKRQTNRYSRRRTRREIRRMTSSQWRRFVQAMQTLKKQGDYDKLAAIHRGVQRLRKAHGGSAFLPWHRIYLLVLEHALRKVRRGVAIPYWDSSLDYHMTDPTKSVLWTYKFLGNCDGRVTTGPFQWQTGQGEDLVRNCGSGGSLISKQMYNNVLSRTKHSEIENPRTPRYWLEGIHNGPHVWVDGPMSLLDYAAEEPAFYLHHCYIDYIWQQFMDKQIKRTKNWNYPYYDYPHDQDGHGANELMDPFGIPNRAGHHQHWYNNFYRYEKSPTCDRRRRRCGSRYLRCDVRNRRCVSVEGRDRIRPGRPSIPRPPEVDAAVKTAPTFPTLRMGRKFVSPFTDPRTAGRQPLRQAPTLSTSSSSGRRAFRPTSKSTNLDFSFLKVKLVKRSADIYEQRNSTRYNDEVCSLVEKIIRYV